MDEFISDLRRVPVLRALLPWLIGTMMSKFLPDKITATVLGIVLLIFLLFWISAELILAKKYFSYSYYACFLILPSLFTGGLFCGALPVQRSMIPETIERAAVTCFVLSGPLARNGNFRYEIRTESLFSGDSLLPMAEGFLLTLDSGYTEVLPAAGERILVSGMIRPLGKGLNPSSFDYAAFMARRNIHYQLFPGEGDTLQVLKYSKTDRWKMLPRRVSVHLAESWQTGDEGAVSVLKAITLGDKGSLSEELRAAYSGAGASHVLAVSGLHVGMIWLILEKLIAFRSKRFYVRFCRSILIMGILWFYAALTGASSSVCRSVTMFSLVSLSGLLNRKSSVLNTLCLSALLLLVIDPRRILDTGFQLSYLAVFGIVLLQPVISGLIRSRYLFIRRIVDLVAVSIAAQMFTFPLTVHLFHQFPLAFILTNLLIIPLATIEVTLFILTAPFCLAGIAVKQITWLLLVPAGLMNKWTGVISGIHGAVLDGLHFSGWSMGIALVTIFLFTAFLVYRKVFWLTASISALAVLFAGLIVYRQLQEQQSDLMVAHFYGSTVLVCNKGYERENIILVSEKTDTQRINSWLEQNSLSECRGRKVETCFFMSDSIEYMDKSLVAETGKGLKIICTGDFIVFRTGRGMKIDTLFLNSLDPDLVITGDLAVKEVAKLRDLYPGIPFIADGSSPVWITGKLPKEVKDVWITGEKGAFILSKTEFIQNSNCGQ